MAVVFLGIGSNTRRDHHICVALEWLTERYPEVQLSSVYESEAIGFEGRSFYNLVARIETDLTVKALVAELKALEYANGREPNAQRFAPRNLDLDVLTYDDRIGCVDSVELPRGEVLYNAFVLWPMAEIAGDARHPVVGTTYSDLWAEFDKTSQKLQKIEFPGTPFGLD